MLIHAPHSNGVGQIVIYIVTSRFLYEPTQTPAKLLADFIAEAKTPFAIILEFDYWFC